jgi:hypothetical protein|tara:strand:+ start:49 stop:441 length:393 start_codon:yes stop_codon:yes gene_type:complete
MPKGLKDCPECGVQNGVRVKKCVECNHPFSFKPSSYSRRFKVVPDWTQLCRGDIIKTVNGTGSYCLSKSGEKIYMNEKGKLKVQRITHEGIQVYGKHGLSFIYMGSPMKSSKSGINRRPSTIKLIENTKL